MKSNLPFLLESIKLATPDSGCIEWPHCRTASGYGLCTYERRTQRVHRISYQVVIGPIREGLLMLHSCDNPPCFNPYHVRPGTHRDNSMDALLRDRQAKVLTVAEVTEIRRLMYSESSRSLASRFGVAHATIKQVWHGESWKHIPWPEVSGASHATKLSRRHLSQLSDDEILEIRSLHYRVPQRTIAARFGVGKSTIGRICLTPTSR